MEWFCKISHIFASSLLSTWSFWCGQEGIPFALIYTKCDKLGPNALKAQIARNEALLSETWEELPPTFCSSAETGAGRDEILDYIDNILQNL